MKNIRNLFDATVAVLGLWLIISAPFMLGMERWGAIASLVVLGSAILGFAIWGETLPESSAPEVVNVFLALLVFVSPWLIGFTDVTAAAWNTWLVGVAMVVLEALAIPGAMLERTPHQPG